MGKGLARIAVECDGSISLITEMEIGRGVAVVSEILQRTAGNRLANRRLSNSDQVHRVDSARAKKGDLTPTGEKFYGMLRNVPSPADHASRQPGQRSPQ